MAQLETHCWTACFVMSVMQVTAEVRAMVGHSIHPEEPLMSAGLDSRGGMELRRALGDSLHLDLPVTLLYDYQSIAAIVGYIEGLVEAQRQGGEEDDGCWGEEQEQGASGARDRRAAVSAVTANKPSKLLKTLRLVFILLLLCQHVPGLHSCPNSCSLARQYTRRRSSEIVNLVTCLRHATFPVTQLE